MENKRTYCLRRCRKVQHTIQYTEDNVPVYNVAIQRMPRTLRPAQIRKYFSKFGQIKDVNIMYGKRRTTPVQCIIKYQNAQSASAALKKRNHAISCQYVTIKSCPSWEQPFEIENPPIGYKIINLISLNDYCLEVVFQNLDLLHQIRLSLCHPRLEQVFMHMICPRLKRNLDLEKLCNFSTWELRQFFYTVGTYLDGIVVGKSFPTCSVTAIICNFMQQCNLRIKRLHIISRDPWQYCDILNSLQLDYITELELYMCNLSDFELERLRKLRNLSVLGLAGNRRIQGINLKHLRGLQRLSLCGCESITNEALLGCCRHLRLSYLDVRLTDSVRDKEMPIKYCSTLETLKLSGINGADPNNIARLPKLKSLEVLHFNSAMASSLYNALAEHHADDLIELKLTGQTYLIFPTVASNIARLHKLRTLWLGDHEYNVSKELIKLVSDLSELEEVSLHYSTRIRDKHLLPLITKCTKLKRINLRMCRYITKKLVWNTLEILRKRAAVTTEEQKAKGTQVNQPLVMLVHGTRIKRDILQDATYKKGQHLLKLLFHVDKPLMGLTNEGSAFDINGTELNCATLYDSDSYSYTDAEDEESSIDEDRDILDIYFLL